jgi:hypothetical protein
LSDVEPRKVLAKNLWMHSRVRQRSRPMQSEYVKQKQQVSFRFAEIASSRVGSRLFQL